MLGDIFLIVLGLIWILFAVIQDLKKREIANWLNFSLVIFALAFRFFYCLFGNSGYSFFIQGVMGFILFFILGNLLYYGKVFAGGDAKLMIGLGAVIPFSESFFLNINLVILFFAAFLIAGALYGIAFSFLLALKNRKNFAKEFSKQFSRKKKLFYLSWVFVALFIILSFFVSFVIYLAIVFFVLPYLYISAKAIDEACMIKKVKTSNLTEGDWLYENIKVSRKLIKAKWEGLSKEEIKLLRKNKKEIFIRQGIPFSPVFLIGYIVLIYIYLTQ